MDSELGPLSAVFPEVPVEGPYPAACAVVLGGEGLGFGKCGGHWSSPPHRMVTTAWTWEYPPIMPSTTSARCPSQASCLPSQPKLWSPSERSTTNRDVASHGPPSHRSEHRSRALPSSSGTHRSHPPAGSSWTSADGSFSWHLMAGSTYRTSAVVIGLAFPAGRRVVRQTPAAARCARIERPTT